MRDTMSRRHATYGRQEDAAGRESSGNEPGKCPGFAWSNLFVSIACGRLNLRLRSAEQSGNLNRVGAFSADHPGPILRAGTLTNRQ
jgi:hypothetical protein